MVKRPPAGTIPEAPGSYQFKDALGPRDLRRQGVEPPPAPVELLRRPPQHAPPHRADGGDGGVGRVDRGPQRGRGADARVQPHQAASTTVQRPPARRQELPVPRRSPSTTSGRGRWSCAAASARACATSGRTPTPTRSATRSTSCCKTFPIRTCSPSKFNQHHRLGRPCLLYHIEKCVGPCVGEIEEMPYDQLVEEMCDFLDGDTDEIVKRLETQHARRRPSELEFERAARLRDRLVARAAGRSPSNRWSPTATRTSTSSASPRTTSKPRSRCSTCAVAGWSGARDSSSTRSRT